MSVVTDEAAALRVENEALRRRLADAEQTLAAIGSGAVDAFVVGEGGEERIYTLETADAPYRLMVERMAQGAATLSADGVVLYANGQLAWLLGVGREHLPGASFESFVPLEDAEAVRGLLARASRESCASEVRLLGPDGAVVPVYLGASPLRLGAAAAGISLIVTDLTAQKHHEALARARDALRESERRLATLVDNLPGVVYRCRNDPHWTLEFASPPFADLVRRPLEDFLAGRVHYAELIHEEDAARVWDAVQAAVAQRSPWELRYRIVVSGETRWVWERGSGQFAADGALLALEGFLVDVSEREHAEQALRQTSRLLRAVVESTPGLIYARDGRGELILANVATDRQLRAIAPDAATSESEISGWPDTGDRTVLETGAGLTVEAQWPGPDGPRTYLATKSPLRDDRGEIVGVVTVAMDIEERKRLEREIGEREARFRGLAEGMPHMVWECDLSGRCLYQNQNWREYVGVPQGEAGGTLWLDHCHPEDRPRVASAWMRAVESAGREPCELETRLRRAGRTSRWFRVTASPVPDASGGVARWVGVCSDIDDAKRALAELAENESRLRFAQRAAGIGVWDWDVAGAGTIACTEEYRELFGLQCGERRDDAEWAARVHPEDLPRLQAEARDVVEQGCGARDEFRIQHPVRGLRWLMGVSEPVSRDERGRATRIIGVNIDVTERKALEEELRRTVALLTEADRRKDAFLATLAHELRNPLAPIRNAVAVLARRGSPEPELVWSREVIQRQVSQMSRLLEDLLDVARISRDRLELRRERVMLDKVVASAVETSRPLLEGAQQSLTVKLPDAPVLLDADPIRLAQVFANLLNNASKYTDRGGHVSLEARCEGGEVAVSVLDDGIGIEREMLPRLFDMFSQAEPARERSQGGLGIGLALVRGLVELHGGTVEAQSAGPGCGSAFVVRLPVLVDERRQVATPEGGIDPPAAVGLRILVADDNRDGAESLALLLRLLGHEVAVAFDGEDALAQAQRFAPAVLVLDLGMPKLGGLEVARAVRASDWGRDAILLALTGWGREDDRRRSQAAGFDHHLVKPVDVEALNAAIARLVRTREGTRRLARRER